MDLEFKAQGKSTAMDFFPGQVDSRGICGEITCKHQLVGTEQKGNLGTGPVNHSCHAPRSSLCYQILLVVATQRQLCLERMDLLLATACCPESHVIIFRNKGQQKEISFYQESSPPKGSNI